MFSSLFFVFCLVNLRVGGLIVLNRDSFSPLYKMSPGVDTKGEERDVRFTQEQSDPYSVNGGKKSVPFLGR